MLSIEGMRFGANVLYQLRKVADQASGFETDRAPLSLSAADDKRNFVTLPADTAVLCLRFAYHCFSLLTTTPALATPLENVIQISSFHIYCISCCN